MDKKIFQNTILEKQYQAAKWQEVLKDYFGVKKLHQQPQSITLPANDIAENAVELGSFYTADDRLVGIYEITIKTEATTKIDINRVGLRSLLRNIYKYDVDAALIVFVHGTKWRFSYVSEIRTEEGKKETEPKRYTYLFGEGESCRTAADRFDKLKGKQIYLNDLFEAFSVEKLNKDFFKTYKEFHERFWKFLADDEKYYKLLCDKRQEDKVKREKPIRDFAKKLLGRIVFLQFLQKKGWMGVSANSTEWIGGDPKFLQSLFAKSNNKNKFHSTEIKDLFFKTLNSKRDNDIAPESLGKDIKIPYLNGGLFDKDISFENSIDFPEEYFAQLLDFFEQYNFTIDENDPYDSEVGIDPEMLGHIFENLLEENREKGAFYTPKEIVHYMCQESLIQYLRTHLPECTEDDSPATKALENVIRNGIIGDRHDKKNFIVQHAKRIEKLLDNVKICDPAIGSGAFPMGMLQEIFKSKTSLDLTLDHADVKRQIIQNNIYGVDIEPGAVDIARLRFWLALVVDETEPQPLPNLDYKIMQGNSLLEQFEDISLKFEKKVFEVKVVKEVDLFGRPINPQYTINEYLQTKQSAKEFDITELEEKYFNSNNADEKQQIREKIENFERNFILEQLDDREKQIKEILKHKETDFEKDLNAVGEAKAEYLSKGKKAKDIVKQKAELEKVRQYRNHLINLKPGEKPWFLWHLYFMDVFDKGGFDIVIGNPPYVGQKGHKEMFQDIKKTELGKKYHQRRMDLFYFFFHQGILLLKTKGLLSYITTNYYLTATYADKLRKHIYEETTILSLINFNELKIFESAQGQHNLITILKKGKFSETIAKTAITQKNGLANEKIIAEIINEEDNETEYNKQNQNSLFEKGSLYIRIEASSSHTSNANGIYAILNKIRSNCEQLEYYCFIEQGIVSGADKVSESHIKEYPNYSFEKGHGIYVLTKEEISNLNFDEEDFNFLKKTYKNSEIRKWMFQPKDDLFVIYIKSDGDHFEPSKKIKNHLDKFKIILINRNVRVGSITEVDYADFLNGSKEISYIMNAASMKKGNYYCLSYARRSKFTFEELKIVNSRRSHLNTFALENKGYYEQSDIVITTLKPEFKNKINILYLLAILNSKLMFSWFYSKGKRKGEQLELFQKPISEVPIKIGDNKIRETISSIVARIIELRNNKLDVSKYENKVDALVFHLYNLTESEMLQVLDNFKDLSIKDRNQIQNEYWNIANNKFQLEI